MTQTILAVSLLVVILLLFIQTRRLMRCEKAVTTATDTLVTREQLAALGRMMAGVAHELKTPLGAVQCAVGTRQKAIARLDEVMADLADPEADRAELLARADKALQALHGTDPLLTEAMTRTEQLLREIRLAGRGETADPQPVAVNDVVRGTLLLAEHELKHMEGVEVDLGEVAPVPGWPGPLGQVLLNLVLNARQAAGDEGTIRITTAMAGDQVVVTVADDGPGLPDGLSERIFEPGVTTKTADSGTGLGLYICRKILQRHQGSITAANGATGGAVFTIVLPTQRTRNGCENGQ